METQPSTDTSGMLAPVTAPRLVLVAETDAHEGPVYVAEEDALYFTTLPRFREGVPEVVIKRVALHGTAFPVEAHDIAVVRSEANAANGMALDRDGRLVVCEQGTRSQPARISRLDRATGSVETVVDAWQGLPLNSPNDVVVRRDGTVWFTDPSYGHLQGFRDAPVVGDHVYRYDPLSRHLEVAADGFDKPNGLAFSPDEEVLYVGDNGVNHLFAFDVVDQRTLAGRRLFAVMGSGHPDGIKVDGEGRVYASVPGGVQVFLPSGDPIGEIALPGAVNFTFGGTDDRVLFITTDTAIWAALIT